jgi:hypothetical protein
LLLAVARPDAEADVILRIGRGEEIHGEDAAVNLVVRKDDGHRLASADADLSVARQQPMRQEFLRFLGGAVLVRGFGFMACGIVGLLQQIVNRRLRRRLRLQAHEFCITAILRNELIVAPLLDESAAIEHQDAMGIT